MTLKEKLINLGACDDALAWVGKMDFATAWQTCERGDWMLWLMKEANLCDLRTLTLAKAKCAETVKHLMRDQRSLDALQAAFDFAEGRIDETQLAAAQAARAEAAAAWAAAEAEAAAEAAAQAEAAAAAWAEAQAEAAAEAAAQAEAAAAAAAAWAAQAEARAEDAAAREKHLKLCADLIREVLPNPTIV